MLSGEQRDIAVKIAHLENEELHAHDDKPSPSFRLPTPSKEKFISTGNDATPSTPRPGDTAETREGTAKMDLERIALDLSYRTKEINEVHSVGKAVTILGTSGKREVYHLERVVADPREDYTSSYYTQEDFYVISGDKPCFPNPNKANREEVLYQVGGLGESRRRKNDSRSTSTSISVKKGNKDISYDRGELVKATNLMKAINTALNLEDQKAQANLNS